MPRLKPRDLFLDYHLLYTGKEIEGVVEEITDIVKENLEGRMRDRKEYKKSIQVLVLNLFNAYRTDSNMPLGIPADSTWYTDSPLGYRTTNNSKLALIKAGYIKQVRKGLHKNFGSVAIDNKLAESRVGAYKGTAKFVKYFRKLNLYSLKINFNTFPSVRVGNKETGTIENPVKRKQFKEHRKSIKEINLYYDTIHIDLFVTAEELTKIRMQMSSKDARDEWIETEEDVLKELNFRRKYLHRKFHDENYNLHGRFYGGFWQSIPSEWRNRITINGKATVEMDYTNMHFAVLYDELEDKLAKPNSDLYDLSPFSDWKEGTQYRNEVKLIMNYMLNCTDDEQVKNVIEKNRAKDFTQGVPKRFRTWQNLIDFIKEVHAPIAHNFYTGQGIRLMYLDSLIAENVIRRGVENDVCILSVHDSFISKFEHHPKVMKWMLDAYKDVIGKYGKSVKFDWYDIDFEAPVELLKDKDISDYLDRIMEWNWHRQSFGDSSLPLIAPLV